MVETALKKKAMDYFAMLDNEQARMVLSYMETIEFPAEKRQHSIADLKGKISLPMDMIIKQCGVLNDFSRYFCVDQFFSRQENRRYHIF